MSDMDLFKQFLVEAKMTSSSGNSKKLASSRPNSDDYTFKKYDYYYLDSHIGRQNFIGQEVIWKDEKSYWGMNYAGKLLTNDIPNGFTTFLKEALSNVTVEGPYRGPKEFEKDGFVYECSWTGEVNSFKGEEIVSYDGTPVFKLEFHGGTLG